MSESHRPLRPFVRMLMSQWKWVAAGTACGLVTISATVGLLALSGWFLSAAAFAGLTTATALAFNYFFPSVGVRIFAIARTLGRYTERIITHDATFRILENLRTWFYRKLEPLSPSRLMQYRSGDILNRIVADIDALDNLYLRALSPSIVAVMLVLLSTYFLSFFDLQTAFTALAFLAFAGLFIPWLAGRLGAVAGRRMAEQTAGLRIRIVESIQGLSELLVFDRSQVLLNDMITDNQNLLQTQRRMSHIRGLSAALITLLAGLAVVAVLYRGTLLVNRGDLDGANLALIALAVLACFDAVMPLPRAFQYLGRTREAGRRLLEIVEARPAVVFPEKTVEQPRIPDVCFEKVSFSYRGGVPNALDNVSFEIDHGEKIAIIGQTGAGKSTLAHLLVRFWDPDSGRIRIGGNDIRQLSEDWLRQNISVVSQQAHLFNASIRDNLVLASPDAGDEELFQALEAVQLTEFVKSLPQGLSTWIGESGKLVSGGQARRLTVARAVLHNAPIRLLDEPTEGLDRVTERKLLQTLFDISSSKTVLMITHHLFGLDRFDRILMLENGQIIEQGTHAELVARDKRYARMNARLDL